MSRSEKAMLAVMVAAVLAVGAVLFMLDRHDEAIGVVRATDQPADCRR